MRPSAAVLGLKDPWKSFAEPSGPLGRHRICDRNCPPKPTRDRAYQNARRKVKAIFPHRALNVDNAHLAEPCNRGAAGASLSYHAQSAPRKELSVVAVFSIRVARSPGPRSPHMHKTSAKRAEHTGCGEVSFETGNRRTIAIGTSEQLSLYARSNLWKDVTLIASML